jgi:uncharacterized membrane protein YbhN (UPF0104 family)
MPEELNPRRLGRRLGQIGAVVVVVTVALLVLPGLGTLRRLLAHASPEWVTAGLALELLSALSYVVIFRAVFCARMRWRLAYQIGMAEQGANSVLSVSGSGGLALGAWALHRGGMSAEPIGRRTVAFFLLTSLANVAFLVLAASLYLVGAFPDDPNPELTYGFAAAAVAVTGLVLALPKLLAPGSAGSANRPGAGRLTRAIRFARDSLSLGVTDAVELLRRRSIGVLAGSAGTMLFDLAVLAAAFKAVGYTPPLGVLVLGYLIGQLGSNLPIPGSIGGLDGGLIGIFVLYHQPVGATTAAVLIYHAIALWIPALLGSIAFVQLRNTLRREPQPAAICVPLADPIKIVRKPALTG